ncbi:MAG TPA: iron ABC transporter permease [Symbiobacteriaceae bacterium]|nr:iron ABC transporter permease [Symbiobacteriaceae bacterium]
MKRSKLGAAGGIAGLIIAALPMLLFLVLPLLSLLILSVTDKPFALLDYLLKLRLGALVTDVAKAFKLEYYTNFFAIPLFRESLKNTLVLGFWVTLAATFMGTVLAFGVTRTRMPMRNAIRVLAVVPFIVPAFIGGYAFTLLTGDNGMISGLLKAMGFAAMKFDLYTPLGIGIIQTFFFFPLVFLSVSAVLENIDSTLEEAAATQGAPRWYAVLTTTLPMSWPGIAGGALLVFVDSIADYGTFGLLAPKGFPLIAVEAYKELTGYYHWGASAMLSVVMVLLAVAVLILQKIWVERGNYTSIHGRRGEMKPLGGKWLGWIMLGVSLLFLIPPLLGTFATFVMSFTKIWGTGYWPQVMTLDNFKRALIDSPGPVKNSLILSLAATGIATLYALAIAYIGRRTRIPGRGLLDGLAMLPFVIPGTAMAVALIVTFNKPPLRLHNTVWILIASYVIRRLPYGVRPISAAFQQLDKSMDESAMTLGASRAFTIWTIIAPLVFPGLLAGSMLVFMTAIKEVSTSIMLAPSKWVPLSAYIYRRLLEQEVFSAAAYAVVLIVLVAGLQWLANRLSRQTS